MLKYTLAHAVAETFDLCDADLRSNNSIALKASTLLTIQDMIDLRYQPHLLK